MNLLRQLHVALPYSQYNKQYNREQLKNELNKNNIQYRFLGKELGAIRNNLDCYVENKAVYEKIAKTKEFLQGLERIKKGLIKYNIALMCVEKDPINCHRAILIGRHLRQEINIEHILFDGTIESHTHLQERLVDIFNLKQQQQLSLFNTNETKIKSHEELIEEAYQLQGQKIAYLKEF